MGYIYKITNNVNGKIYIGQTSKTVQERFNAHISKAKAHVNRYLYDAMNHYGIENFSAEEIEQCPKEMLDEREIYWISFYKSDNKENGYNMTSGGGGGDTWYNNPHKDITRQKAKETKIKNGTWLKGAPKGTPSPNKGKYKVEINEDEFLNDIKSFMTIEDMCDKYNTNRRTLYWRCKQYYGKTPTELRGDRLKHTNTRKINFDKEELLQYIKDGKTTVDIAKIYNTKKEIVRRRIIEYFGSSIKELRKNVN